MDITNYKYRVLNSIESRLIYEKGVDKIED